ncbi:MAG: alpha/beta hydrolase [Clostridiales bacterium]|jgi:acetyl esterase/lipase|nr:alpha/beta hydrolase [Clostridiales bacterium]
MGLSAYTLKRYWALVKKADDGRIALQKPTDGVGIVSDIAYIDDGNRAHLLDIYFPENADGNGVHNSESAAKKLPVIMDIHGGGWTYGEKYLNKYYCMYLASKGFTVVNINYRLAPETQIDGQIRDILAAIEWIKDNIDKYNGDIGAFGMAGDSAGGHLAILAAAVNSSDTLAKKYGVVRTGVSVKALGLTCSAFNIDLVFKLAWLPLGRYILKILLGKEHKNSPFKNDMSIKDVVDFADLPPIYMVSGKEDFVHSHSASFSEAAKNAGIDFVYHDWEKGKNGYKLTHVFNILYPAYPESIETNDEFLDFFVKHL